MLEIQSELETKTEENSLLETTVETLKKTTADQAQKIDNYIQRIKDVSMAMFYIVVLLIRPLFGLRKTIYGLTDLSY